ncbi:hypothetical protein ES332_D01G033900v1 [Gossypium tomentosum]|uniref:Pectinesterase inhibitor domain-containing protein n=1 Tax=Gossypium tomentosum TaxID=34277 RepID=A0A5D2M4U2_GOSTO|nr:hypothetical protein ES332_D01G033900v1 [Gossypium tomentosum]
MPQNLKAPLLFSLILGFLATQAISISNKKTMDLIEQTCRQSGFFALCNSTLRSDPRSSNANLEGLAKISVEIVIDKANATLNFIVDLFKNVSDPILYRSYGTCIDSYGASVQRLLPEAIAALGSKDYATSRHDVATVATNVNACDEQFPEKTPFSDRNRLVHDLSLMSAGIIELLG